EKSGSRAAALQHLQTPTLVIHGKADPLIPFEHGLKTAALIPNAQTLWLDGMGHLIPPLFTDTIVSGMVALFATSETQIQSPSGTAQRLRY
ncbi:alpha/beta fold hydrolase, partial [Bacteroidota bacterium]